MINNLIIGQNKTHSNTMEYILIRIYTILADKLLKGIGVP